ncbi:MAG: hypothetical protein AMXMBFR56_12020 [Polyangiaceae bacterium]
MRGRRERKISGRAATDAATPPSTNSFRRVNRISIPCAFAPQKPRRERISSRQPAKRDPPKSADSRPHEGDSAGLAGSFRGSVPRMMIAI